MRVQDATGPNEFVTFAVVQIIIHDQQIIVTGPQRIPSGGKCRHNPDLVRRQELLADLGCKNGVILDVKDLRLLLSPPGDAVNVPYHECAHSFAGLNSTRHSRRKAPSYGANKAGIESGGNHFQRREATLACPHKCETNKDCGD